MEVWNVDTIPSNAACKNAIWNNAYSVRYPCAKNERIEAPMENMDGQVRKSSASKK